MASSRWHSFAVAPLIVALSACSPPRPAPPSDPAAGTPGRESAAAPVTTAPPADDLPPVRSPYDALPPASRALLDQPFTGDLDAMIRRRVIRAGVIHNRTQYFVDKGVQRGLSYDAITLFEQQLNARLKTGVLKVHVAIVPMSRDQLFPALRDGKVDFVAAALTITPERRLIAEFSRPTRTGVLEVPVTGPGHPPLESPDALSGREVFVRRSSSYNESLRRLNASLEARGRPPVAIRDLPESLEDDDALEMVQAGLIDVTIVDDFVAEVWQQVFPRLQVHPGAAVRTGGEIAIGVRRSNPNLLRALNVWVEEYGPRTAFGNIMQRRYLEGADYVKNATDEAGRKKLEALVDTFENYSVRYDVDYLLMLAQAYQESRLDHSARSRVGAVGVMQVMPATGRELRVGDIRQLEPNIHAGIKYFRFMMDQYYGDEPMDALNKGLMTLASYNAGPGRMRQLRAETARRGLDANVWFGNVERVVSERIGRETVQYVSNIYKYYVAYRLLLARNEAREEARKTVTSP
jgi:membrane-bound lytic murein transglycosylase MltF